MKSKNTKKKPSKAKKAKDIFGYCPVMKDAPKLSFKNAIDYKDGKHLRVYKGEVLRKVRMTEC